jgi:hypothetical protein
MVERMVVEVPSQRGFDVGDLTIAGSPIRYGGQIAECITVKLIGIANILPAPILREPAGFTSRAIIDPFYPRTVGWVLAKDPIPPGFAEAFLDQGSGDCAVTVPAPRAITRCAILDSRPEQAIHVTRKIHGKHRYELKENPDEHIRQGTGGSCNGARASHP